MQTFYACGAHIWCMWSAHRVDVGRTCGACGAHIWKSYVKRTSWTCGAHILNMWRAQLPDVVRTYLPSFRCRNRMWSAHPGNVARASWTCGAHILDMWAKSDHIVAQK